jgi:hypothetical protein
MRAFVLRMATAGLFACALAVPARADVLIKVDKAAQRMTVEVDGQPRYVWPVSTGIAEYDTPNGAFTPFRMEADHYSKEWDDAPMPYSIFFTKQGHAIHGTTHASIGRPASHGCVRLKTANAEILYGLVKKQGLAHTTVVLTGKIPESAPAVAKRSPAPRSNDDYAVTRPPLGIDPYTVGRAPRDDDNGYMGRVQPAPAYADENDDDDVTSALPAPRTRQVQQGYWRENRDGPRYYYYRVRPYQSQQPQRNYGGFLSDW